MSWRAQNRSKDAKTPSAALAMSRNPKPELCGIQLDIPLRCFKTVFVVTMITMAFAGIRRQASRVEKGEFVMGVVMEFFDAKFRAGAN
jgi:hypothetical protein